MAAVIAFEGRKPADMSGCSESKRVKLRFHWGFFDCRFGLRRAVSEGHLAVSDFAHFAEITFADLFEPLVAAEQLRRGFDWRRPLNILLASGNFCYSLRTMLRSNPLKLNAAMARRAHSSGEWFFVALVIGSLTVSAQPVASTNPPASPFQPTVENKTPAPVPAPEGMVWVPGGEFSMGSDESGESLCSLPGVTRDSQPIHRVYVDGFWMDATEVTNEQFEKFVKATEPSSPSPSIEADEGGVPHRAAGKSRRRIDGFHTHGRNPCR